MNKPQFAERQYETAANIELARGAATPFVPTQNAEFYLGIDAVHNPRDLHAIWRILSVQVPRRVMLSPTLWPSLPHGFHDEIPGRYASLFVQYKGPVHQDNRRAKHFSRIGGAYYQVQITSHQQRRLKALENRLSSRAVVRYAAPAFWSRTDFDRHDAGRQILQHSAFVSPALVGVHHKWCYTAPNGRMLFNPDPEEFEGDSWDAILRLLAERARRQSLRDHIHDLATSLSGEVTQFPEGQDRQWIERLQRYGRFDSRDIETLIELSTIALIADGADVDWIILLNPDTDWKNIISEDQLHRPPFWFYPW